MSPYDTKGPVVRFIYLAVALAGAAIRKFLRRSNPRIVLCYHGVTAAQRPRFEQHMRCLAALPNNGKANVEITFDDAYANLLENALPILRDLGIKPRVFFVSSNFGTPPRWDLPPSHPDAREIIMTRTQLQDALKAELLAAGSHTSTHPRLTEISDELLASELEDSRKILESACDATIDELAFPFGAYDPRVVEACRRAGYRTVFSLDEQPRNADGEFVVGRFLMTPEASLLEFRLTCQGAYLWLGPWRRLCRAIRAKLRPMPRLERKLA